MVTVHVRVVTPAPTYVHWTTLVPTASVRASASQSSEPPKPWVSVTVAGLPGATADVLTVNLAVGSIVNTSALVVPPPGPGVWTLTIAVPSAGRSLAAIEASSFVVLISRVGRSAPFQRTTENVVNPAPITRSFNGPDVARTCVGSVALMVGTGFVTGMYDARARSSLIRGIVVPPRKRSSRTGSPVFRRLSRMSDTPAVGAA